MAVSHSGAWRDAEAALALGERAAGVALCCAASMFNHDCAPNVRVEADARGGGALVARALAPLRAGERATISCVAVAPAARSDIYHLGIEYLRTTVPPSKGTSPRTSRRTRGAPSSPRSTASRATAAAASTRARADATSSRASLARFAPAFAYARGRALRAVRCAQVAPRCARACGAGARARRRQLALRACGARPPRARVAAAAAPLARALARARARARRPPRGRARAAALGGAGSASRCSRARVAARVALVGVRATLARHAARERGARGVARGRTRALRARARTKKRARGASARARAARVGARDSPRPPPPRALALQTPAARHFKPARGHPPTLALARAASLDRRRATRARARARGTERARRAKNKTSAREGRLDGLVLGGQGRRVRDGRRDSTRPSRGRPWPCAVLGVAVVVEKILLSHSSARGDRRPLRRDPRDAEPRPHSNATSRIAVRRRDVPAPSARPRPSLAPVREERAFEPAFCAVKERRGADGRDAESAKRARATRNERAGGQGRTKAASRPEEGRGRRLLRVCAGNQHGMKAEAISRLRSALLRGRRGEVLPRIATGGSGPRRPCSPSARADQPPATWAHASGRHEPCCKMKSSPRAVLL